MGLVKQTEFFDEVCFPPLLSFRLFSAAKHKKSRFYCFVLNRYAHTDARTLCIKSLLQQTHSKRESQNWRPLHFLHTVVVVVAVVVVGNICTLTRWLGEWKIPEQMSHEAATN